MYVLNAVKYSNLSGMTSLHGFTWGMRVFCAALSVNVKAFAVSTADVYSQMAKR